MKHFLAAAAVIALAGNPAQAASPWSGNVVAQGCQIATSDTNGYGENRTDAAIAGICTGLVVAVVHTGNGCASSA